MSSEPKTSDHPLPTPVQPDVWRQLREQMEQVNAHSIGSSDPLALAERLAERARVLRTSMARPATGPQITFLAFNKQRERYGILLDEVAAVESLDHFTPVPNAPAYIRGVTPWRGAILSLLDLGRLFGRSESGIADLRACVIVEAAGRRLAVVAHEVEEILSVPTSELTAVPELPNEIAPEWVVGLHDENRLILRMAAITEGIANKQTNGL